MKRTPKSRGRFAGLMLLAAQPLLAVTGAIAVEPATTPAAATATAAGPTATLTSRQQEGKRLFNGSCVYCHGPNVWGTFTLGRRLGADSALLEKRTDLVGPYVKTVVRAGVGSMPAFRRTELSDADVDAIVDYLTRANPAKQ